MRSEIEAINRSVKSSLNQVASEVIDDVVNDGV